MAEEVVKSRGRCRLHEEGFEPGCCMVVYEGERTDRACQVTLRWKGDIRKAPVKTGMK